MKSITYCLLSLFLAIITASPSIMMAQYCDQYNFFEMKDLTGLSDDNGNEIIPPYDCYTRYLPSINKVAFIDFDNSLLFDCATKKITKYKHISTNAVSIKNEDYALLSTKDDKYSLLNQETGVIVPLQEEIYSIDNIGKYIIAKYFKKYVAPKPTPIKKDKNGIPLPPERERLDPPDVDKSDYMVFANDLSFKPIIKGEFTKITPLYKKEKIDNDDINIIREVEIIDISDKRPFDAIVFSNKDKHQLYDSNLKAISTFTLKENDENFDEKLAAHCTKIVFKNGENISFSNNSFNSFVAAPVDIAAVPSSGNKKPEKPPRVFPEVKIIRTPDLRYNVRIYKSETDSVTLFSSLYQLYNKYNEQQITVKDDDNNELALFFIDKNTAAIYLPKKYWAELKMQ